MGLEGVPKPFASGGGFAATWAPTWKLKLLLLFYCNNLNNIAKDLISQRRSLCMKVRIGTVSGRFEVRGRGRVSFARLRSSNTLVRSCRNGSKPPSFNRSGGVKPGGWSGSGGARPSILFHLSLL